jgi:hypothetical protein
MTSLLRSFALVPFLGSLTLAVACGGSIETVPGNGSDPARNGNTSSGGSSSGSSSGSGSRGGQCDGRPECDAGDTKYASQEDACKETAGSSCYSRAACGETVWCQHFEGQCAGYPSCPAGYAEVKACIPDSDCKTATMCGVTIVCQKADTCEGAMPICDPGDTQVASSSECLQDDARCYSRSNACGFTIWCTGPAN